MVEFHSLQDNTKHQGFTCCTHVEGLNVPVMSQRGMKLNEFYWLWSRPPQYPCMKPAPPAILLLYCKFQKALQMQRAAVQARSVQLILKLFSFSISVLCHCSPTPNPAAAFTLKLQ